MIEGFNAQQSLAIETSPDIDVIISAGAGSGKTKTLTKKVFELVDTGAIKPSELLVLTFTNNAAHEMKERIVRAFGGNSKAQEMLSAHVQTFDSFSQYLVSTNAGALGIASRISVANDSILDAKKLAFLDELLEEYYADPIQRERVLSTLKKIDFQDDSNLKKDVLAITKFLNGLTPSKRKDFVENYAERYLSNDFCEKILHEFVVRAKKDIVKAIRDAYFLERHHDFTDTESISYDLAKAAYEDPIPWAQDIKTISFADEVANALLEKILPLLDLEGAEFISACNSFGGDNPEFMKPRRRKKTDPEDLFLPPYKTMRILFATVNCTLGYLKPINSEAPLQTALEFKDDILLLLELAQKLEGKLWDYKRATNSFTFSDISTMALSLLTDPKHAEVAKSIRGRFNFIMVDEYQDTNDFQEQFIDALSATRDDGTRAHLFFVGDAKQSIYAFRNSNVALFRKRQSDYASGDEHLVIPMNTNYRSCPQLLHDINYIFKSYMRLDHGGIDFMEPAEQLDYDQTVNLYRKPYDNAGIYRIHSMSEERDDGVPSMEWECAAIIADIRKKVAEGHLVYDRDCKGPRPCKYGDFLILMRKKAQFSYYRERFQEEGIPLNSEIQVSLRDISPVILMQSLSSLISAKLNNDPADVKHLFASIARSYAYRYEDRVIFALCMDDALLNDDPLMRQIDEFAASHADSQFEEIFLDMVDEFHVVSDLYLVGNVQDSIAKIDSLHSLALSLSSMGEGIREFAKLFRDLNKYNLDISSDDANKSDNAVTLMSIHGSKGLEQKIVYMPESVNCMASGSNIGKPDMDISEEYGILLPDYSIRREEGQMYAEDHSIYSLPYLAYINSNLEQVDLDEHVRLFYVALTRAENAIYLVGDDMKKREDLYEMLRFVPFYETIDPQFAEVLRRRSPSIKAAIDAYSDMVRIKKGMSLFEKKPATLPQMDFEVREELTRFYFGPVLDEKMEQSKDTLRISSCSYYLDKVPGADDDLIARFVSHFYFGNPNIFNLEELNAYIASIAPTEAASVDESSEDAEASSEEKSKRIKPYTSERLSQVRQALIDRNVDFFGIALTAEERNKDASAAALRKLAKRALPSLAFAFDGYKKIFSVSYESDEYSDRHYAFDYFSSSQKSMDAQPVIPHVRVDDSEIDFPVLSRKKASKSLSSEDEEALRPILERGELLHRYMEIVDLKSKDTSFIADPSDRALIDAALKMECFQDLEGAEIYKEYGYFDTELNNQGYIDLLVVKGDIYWIIDYKTSHIEDLEYDNQLKNYARNVMRLFNINKDKVKMTLVSLMQGKSRDIAQE